MIGTTAVTQTVVYYRYDAVSQGYVLRFAYDARVVDFIKSATRDRQWQPDAKVWTVGPFGLSQLQALAFTADISMREDTPPAPTPVVAGAQVPIPASPWAVQLLSRCAPQLRANVLRSLSTALHPDSGGDRALMSELTAAAVELAGLPW